MLQDLPGISYLYQLKLKLARSLAASSLSVFLVLTTKCNQVMDDWVLEHSRVTSFGFQLCVCQTGIKVLSSCTREQDAHLLNFSFSWVNNIFILITGAITCCICLQFCRSQKQCNFLWVPRFPPKMHCMQCRSQYFFSISKCQILHFPWLLMLDYSQYHVILSIKHLKEPSTL